MSMQLAAEDEQISPEAGATELPVGFRAAVSPVGARKPLPMEAWKMG
jgi:hypothetical protein